MVNRTDKSRRHLRDYLDVISRRRWPVISVFLLVLGLIALYTFTATKIYSASTLLLIEQSSSRPLSLQEALAVDTTAMDFYRTQYRLLESRTISEAVVRRLQLHTKKEFCDPPYGAEATGGVEPPTLEMAINKAINTFNKRRGIAPVRQSRLVAISFESQDPQLAAQGANTIAQVYMDYTLERKLKVSQMAVQFLNKRIEEQRQKLEASQLALQQYMEENNMATAVSDNYSQITAEKLADLKSQLVDAETARKEAQARFSVAMEALNNPRMAESVQEILNSPVFQAIRKRELEVAEKKAELSARYGPKHPKMAGVRAEEDAVARDKRNEIKKIVGSLESEYKVALAKETAIRDALANQQKDAMAFRKKAIGFSALKREVDTNQHLFNMLLTRSKEARVAEDIDVGTVTVVDLATVPRQPSWPRYSINLVAGFVLALILGVGTGFLLQYMDNTIKFPDQVESDLGMPFLVAIPYDGVFKKDGLKPGKPPAKGQAAPKQPMAAMHSQTGEAFRSLRTSLALSRTEGPPKALLITSASPSEGKTVVASLLAATYADAGLRTILIDSDLRKPRQHRLWGISRDNGLTSILSGNAGLDEVVKRGVARNLDILASGPLPPNPAELIHSEVMNKLVLALKKYYDMVIIDSPPVLPVADANVLSAIVDGTIMVIAAGKTPDYAIKQAVQRLDQTQGHLVGVVLNQVQHGRGDYYYGGYKYRYAYQYSYGQEKSA